MDKATLSLIVALISLLISISGYWYSRALTNAEKRSSLLTKINMIIRRQQKTYGLLKECGLKCPKASPLVESLLEDLLCSIAGCKKVYDKLEKADFFVPAHKLQMLMPYYLEMIERADDVLSRAEGFRNSIVNCGNCPPISGDTAP